MLQTHYPEMYRVGVYCISDDNQGDNIGSNERTGCQDPSDTWCNSRRYNRSKGILSRSQSPPAVASNGTLALICESMCVQVLGCTRQNSKAHHISVKCTNNLRNTPEQPVQWDRVCLCIPLTHVDVATPRGVSRPLEASQHRENRRVEVAMPSGGESVLPDRSLW